MAKKYWAESGDRGFNNSGTIPEPTNKKLSDKYCEKRIKSNIFNVRKKPESFNHLVSSFPILTPTEYKEKHIIGHNIY